MSAREDLVAVGNLDPAEVVEIAAALESARETKQVREMYARVGELESALAVQTARAEERKALIATPQAVIAGLLPPATGMGAAS